MTELPRLHYLTTSLDPSEAYPIWCEVLSPLFEPRPNTSNKTPLGSAAAIILGETLIARVTFNSQDFVRDAARRAATPHHVMLHLYLSGGFTGSITGQHVTIWPGQVAVIDLAQDVETRAAASNSIALIVPRRLFPPRILMRLKPKLDSIRNRLLAAHIASLRARCLVMTKVEAAQAEREMLQTLSRLLDPEAAIASEVERLPDASLMTLAEAAVQDQIASPDLSPETLAAELKVSRATLYRLFAEHGGIMRYVQERRLLATQSALSDPLEQRTLARLAADLGFRSDAHFSRSFKARFGTTASAYRALQKEITARAELTSVEIVKSWWEQAEGV